MELFDKKFVHFMWDDSLDGKWGFCSSNIQSLQMFVEAGADPSRWKEGTPPYFLKKGTEKEPFMVQGLGFFSFAYYDPNYSVKWAYYKEGKKIQVTPKGTDKWVDLHCEPKWDLRDEYRVKPECPCEDGIDSKACVGCEHSEDGKRKYKPYVTVDDFIQDFQERFPTAVPRPAYTMPLIWLKEKEAERINLCYAFVGNCVELGCGVYNMTELFEDWTYTDGSPVGMEVKE